MFNPKNIDHIIASVVTQIALTLPVAYIQSISFFNDKIKIADYSWEQFQQHGNMRFYGSDTTGSEFAQANPTIIVYAIDVDGVKREFTTPLENIFR
jgi:hypothetical protein